MRCPNCQAETSQVKETRRAGHGIRRRRECAGCGERFTTYERLERAPLRVRKRDGRAQPFDRVKLRAGLLRAAHKRPVSAAAIEQLVERIEAETARAGGELAAARIGEMCLAGLREIDRVAYLQFAAVYKELDLDDVQAELAELRGGAHGSAVFAGDDAGLSVRGGGNPA